MSKLRCVIHLVDQAQADVGTFVSGMANGQGVHRRGERESERMP
jgi:hypothetical protein